MPAPVTIECVRQPTPELRETLDTIADLMNMELRVTDFDGTWVTFHIPRLTSEFLLGELERRWHAARMFDPALQEMQIMCPWRGKPQRDLYLRELDMEEQKVYQSGFCYWK